MPTSSDSRGEPFFYHQRSHLAWCYGQTCLALANEDEYGAASEWLDEANGWASWRSYKAAFAAIGAGFTEFALVAVGPKWTSSFRDYLLVALPLVIAAGYAVPMFYVMKKYNLEDQPWVAFLARLGIKVVK